MELGANLFRSCTGRPLAHARRLTAAESRGFADSNFRQPLPLDLVLLGTEPIWDADVPAGNAAPPPADKPTVPELDGEFLWAVGFSAGPRILVGMADCSAFRRCRCGGIAPRWSRLFSHGLSAGQSA